MIRRLISLTFFLVCIVANAFTQEHSSSLPEYAPHSPVVVPTELSAWKRWVQDRHPEWNCASRGADVECVWPGHLSYAVSQTGASFTLHVEVLRESSVPLPANDSLHPREISVLNEDGGSVAAPLQLGSNNTLSVLLPRGHFQIKGSFSWNSLPKELPAPTSYGIVDVTHENLKGDFRVRRDSASLWLEAKSEETTNDNLSISVMRRISDGSPLHIETLLRLRVSGRTRQYQIEQVIPEGFSPVALESSIPGMISAHNALVLQLLPGEFDVRVLAVAQQPVAKVTVPQNVLEEWPKEEVWSWKPDMTFRSVEVSGGEPIHADLTQLPGEWKDGAVYVIKPGDSFSLSEVRRGEQAPAPNDIRLNRTMWIDLDGSGGTMLDNFQGQLNRDFRINALPDTSVGRASISGQPVLVTLDPESGIPGIELRNQALQMEVVSRVDNARKIHATGWDTPVDGYSFTLNLPPSWKLLHVSGAVEASAAWVDSWTLLEIFVTILIILASFKLFGVAAAAVLGCSLILNHDEFLAPQMFYIHLLILAAWQAITAGRASIWHTLSRALLAITYAAWGLQALAFAKLQFTQALFPQLQAGTRYRTIIQVLLSGFEETLLAWPLLLGLVAIAFLAIRSVIRAGTLFKALVRLVLYGIGFVVLLMFTFGIIGSVMRFGGSHYSAPQKRMQTEYFDQSVGGSIGESYLDEAMPSSAPQERSKNSVVNQNFTYAGKNLLSGPAVPSWHWRSHYVSVATPLDPNHTLRFYLLSPFLNRLVCAIRAVLVLILLVQFFRLFGFSIPTLRLAPAAAAAALFIALATYVTPAVSHADFPSEKLLDELENRLAQDRCTEAPCAVIESASFSTSGSTLKMSLVVSSDGISSILLPGPLDTITPFKVTRNGKNTIAMRRQENGFLEVRTNNGRNTFEIENALPEGEEFSIRFHQRPLVVNVNAPEWYVEGLSASGAITDSIRLIKRAQQAGKVVVADQKGSALRNWVVAHRSISIGENISVATMIRRIGNITHDAQVRVPLLPNERITSGAVSIEKNELLVSFQANQQEMQYTSVIPFVSKLPLVAAQVTGITEEWDVTCEPIVACEASGPKPIASIIGGQKTSRWLPYPGEEVSIAVQILRGIQGDFVTIDTLTHDVRWGANVLESSLRAQVRVTQQATFSITVPAGSTIKRASLDGQAGQDTQSGTQSSILLSPGSHSVELAYVQPWSPGLFERAPEITLSNAAHNLSILVRPSSDRWILWTGGPSWGPCVVFWSKMLFVILLTLLLTRFGLLPLSSNGAVVAGIGLSTLPLILLAVPLVWLVLLQIIPHLTSKLLKVPRWIRMITFVAMSIAALTIWYSIVQTGLVLAPPMLIAGNGSTSFLLKWYVDHVGTSLPQPFVISLPLWCWRVVALCWSTWLVTALFQWLKRCIEIIRSEFFAAG